MQITSYIVIDGGAMVADLINANGKSEVRGQQLGEDTLGVLQSHEAKHCAQRPIAAVRRLQDPGTRSVA